MNLNSNANSLPPPAAFGFDPSRFPTWRPNQVEAVLRVVDSKKRVSAECQPTGAGKSLLAMAASRLTGARTVYLTRRKGLQTQLTRDFPVHDVRGQGSYPCVYSPSVAVDLGPCHAGMNCRYRQGGCSYYDAVAEARDPSTPVTVTNYAFWFMQAKRGAGLGRVDLLVCDEAHGVLDELSNFLTVEIARWEVERLGASWPQQYQGDIEQWRKWAAALVDPVANAIESHKAQAGTSPAAVRERRRLESLKERLGALADAEGKWAVDVSERGGTLRACPVWPGAYLERYLFQGATKVLFMSATLRPKALQLLDLAEGDYDYWETPSSFSLQNRMVWCVEAPRMNHRIEEAERSLWLDRIDAIIGARLDRKLILHVGSYERRNFLITHSRFRQHMLGHAREDLDDVIAEFKVAPPPAVLVSQSLTEGFDFPDDECRAQIIAKIPYPDSRDALVKARQAEDKEYGSYVAMQAVVQAAGRAVRSADDYCETFVVDGNARWFFRQNARFAPDWFSAAVRQVTAPPEPRRDVPGVSLGLLGQGQEPGEARYA